MKPGAAFLPAEAGSEAAYVSLFKCLSTCGKRGGINQYFIPKRNGLFFCIIFYKHFIPPG